MASKGGDGSRAVSPSAGPVLRGLRSRDDERRLAAVAAATGSTDGRVVVALAMALCDPLASVRRAAANFLLRLDDALVSQLSADTDKGLLEALTRALRDGDAQVGRAAARLLRHGGDSIALEQLTQALFDEVPAVRLVAVQALEGSDDEVVSESLRQALLDADSRVRRAAARAVALSQDSASVSALLLAGQRDSHMQGLVGDLLVEGARVHIRELIGALAQSEAPIRRMAARGLRGAAPEFAVPALEAILADPAVVVRRAAVESLGIMGGDLAARKALILALSDRDKRVRAGAIPALSLMNTAGEYKNAALVLAKGDAPSRRAAAAALGSAFIRAASGRRLKGWARQPERVIVDAFRSAASDPDAETRRLSLLGLAPDASSRTVALLVSSTLDPESSVRAAAYDSLRGADPASPGLLDAALRGIHDIGGVWQPAVALLERAGLMEGQTESVRVGGFVELLDHRDPIRREAAARAIPVNLPAALQALVAALGDPVPSVAEMAAVRLGRSGSSAVIEALIAFVGHPDRRLSAIASYGLVAAGNFGLRDRLIAGLDDPRPRVRSAAMQSLAYLDEEAARPAVERLRGDPVAAVRVAALKTLQQMDQIRTARERGRFVRYFTAPNYGSLFLADLRSYGAEAVHGRKRRYLNTQLSTEPGADAMATDQNLAPGEPYVLQLHIGPLFATSAVINPDENPFPDLAIDGDLDLDVFTISDEFDIAPGPHLLRLPRDGSSEVLHVDLRAPSRSGPAFVRILVFHEGNCLMTQVLQASVGDVGRGYQVVIDYVLTGDLSQLHSLAPQALVMHFALGEAGELRLVAHGSDHDMFVASLNDLQVREAVTIARNALLDIHFGRDDGPSRYDRTNSRPLHDFREDLALLAVRGWTLYQKVITDPRRRREFRKLLRATSILQGWPAAVQVVKGDLQSVAFPWQLVYEIPVSGHPPKFVNCPTLEDWLTGKLSMVPTVCPHEHSRNTLCPFGFWGFAYELASPPSAASNSRALVVSQRNRRPVAIAAVSDDLDPSISRDHLDRIRESMTVNDVRTSRSLEAGLATDGIDIVYFYCHGKREDIPGGSVPRPLLEIGVDDIVAPEDILAWVDEWPEDHWTDSRPLVLMNGCHTSELTPDMLVDFVTTFEEARASGAIGTEIALTQPVAGEATERLLGALIGGHSVASAVRQMRWELMKKGNLMGLAFTPYCYGALKLRS